MKMSNKVYDILKFISLIAGYVATFILTLTDIWGFRYGTAIAATVSALGVCLGLILTKSSFDYKADQIIKEHDNNTD